MSGRRLGLGFIGLGGILIVVGIVGFFAARGSNDEHLTSPTTAATIPPTTATIPPTTTTAPATTTTATTASTTTASTTTTIPTEPVEEFVSLYAAATESRDISFLVARLHPFVLERHTLEDCHIFISDVVTLIRNYRLTGPVAGPEQQSFQLGGRTVLVDVYPAPVAFELQGSTIERTAVFAYVDNEVRWFTDCGAGL